MVSKVIIIVQQMIFKKDIDECTAHVITAVLILKAAIIVYVTLDTPWEVTIILVLVGTQLYIT